MHPEDRLDALLAERARAAGNWGRDGAELDAAGDDELAPLLESARRLAPLRAAQPDRAFAHALEARMLAHATVRLRARPIDTRQARPWRRRLPGGRPWLPAIGRSALRPALLAAAALLAAVVGTLTVATAAAGPGSPLFGLHRLEQGVQVGAAADSAARASGHLELAHQWLGAVQNAAAQHLGDPTYSDALQALRDEEAAAAHEIAQVPPGAARTALEADLVALHADESTTLQAALAFIGWPDRITTTDALGALGAAVPRVSGATLVAGDERWQVTLSGSRFLPGAVLLVDGRSAGVVTATSATSLTAELRRDDDRRAPPSLGIGNPDGTAATTNNVQVVRPVAPTPATPAATVSPAEREGTPGTGGDHPGGTATPGSGESHGSGGE